ncbi:hypothetical protein [Deinococcus radiophilus]|uniref:hypothetical protein n=1 Tax=Deinococcus radiophilus TaxID=32062 RepID=UPI00360937AD
MTLPSFLTLILTEIGWNLAVWLPTVLLSLLFIRLVLGVPMRELVAEIEDHQTAAIGAVFFWASLGFALLFSRVVAAPAPLTELSWSQAFVWLGMAVGLSLLLFSLGVWLVFGTLARRKGRVYRATCAASWWPSITWRCRSSWGRCFWCRWWWPITSRCDRPGRIEDFLTCLRPGSVTVNHDPS